MAALYHNVRHQIIFCYFLCLGVQVITLQCFMVSLLFVFQVEWKLFLMSLFLHHCATVLNQCVGFGREPLQHESLVIIVFIFIYLPSSRAICVSCSALRPGLGGAACWRLAVGGMGNSCMQGTLSAACCGFCPPFKPRSVSLHSPRFSFFLPIFFSLPVPVLVENLTVRFIYSGFGVGSHMSLAVFSTSMTVILDSMASSSAHVCLQNRSH